MRAATWSYGGTFHDAPLRLKRGRTMMTVACSWRRLTDEYTSDKSGDTYLFIYRIPHPELDAWHRESLLWPLSALGIALVVLTLFSLLVTLSITRPLRPLTRCGA